MKKQIDIKKQPRLSPDRILNLTLHGIQYRLFRSVITVMVIAVAVAFLMNILGESLIKRQVAQRIQSQLHDLRLATVWTSRLSLAGDPQSTIFQLSTLQPNTPMHTEMMHFSRLNRSEFDQLQAQAKTAATYLAWFQRLNYSDRRQLVHRATSTQVFDYLRDTKNWDSFTSVLANLRSIRLPHPPKEMAAFLKTWPTTQSQVQVIIDNRKAAITTVGPKAILPRLTTIDKDFGQHVRQAGFQLDEQTATKVAKLARAELDRRFISASITDPNLTINKDLGAKLDHLPQDIQPHHLWEVIATTKGAQWYLDIVSTRLDDKPQVKQIFLDQGYRLDFQPQDLVDLASAQEREQSLLSAESQIGDTGGGFMGLGERLSWLVLVSLVVCTVGIANAMLMAVTERFREIATLKCLGALDGFIMTMFVLEACMLGAAGGLIGALLGLLISVVRMLATFGGMLGSMLPWGDLILGTLIAIITGIILAALAAIYPSFKAARLAPMEAMRIE